MLRELHDDAVMHWLQQELVRSLLDQGSQPSLGAEMLEADDQLVVNEYLAGVVNFDKLDAAANLGPTHPQTTNLFGLGQGTRVDHDRHQRASALRVVGLQARA